MTEIRRNLEIKDKLVFEASEGGEVLSTVTAEIRGDTLVITECNGSGALLDGTLRAALAYAESRFVKSFEIEAAGEVHNELLRLGFVENDKKLTNNITNFFATHKNCKK